MESSQQFVLAIDQGTSSVRVFVYDSAGRVVAWDQVKLQIITQHSGWVEQDPTIIMDTCYECIGHVIKRMKDVSHPFSPKTLAAIGITNQRETTLIWDKTTGKPFANAIVWSDTRTQEIALKLSERLSGGIDHFRSTTGLPISTYFSAAKILWLCENVPEVRVAIEEDRALFGTVDTWLVWNLTGGINGGIHITDVTNASRTLLYNLHTKKWDDDICEELNIPMSILPSVRSSAEVYGQVNCAKIPWLNGVTIASCIGDQHAALLGQNCLQPGFAKSTYGTGCFILYNTGESPIFSTHNLITTVAYQLGPNAPVVYALEGSIATAGSAIDWLVECMSIVKDPKEITELASTVDSTCDVYFVPAFSGLFAPYWRLDARGLLIGLTSYTKKAHIARAVLEAIAFQVQDILTSMEKDSGYPISLLKVDGGLSHSDALLQIQSDIVGISVERPEDIETTARGAAFTAGLAVGLYNMDSMILQQPKTYFTREIDEIRRLHMLKRWQDAIKKSFGWAQTTTQED